MHPDLMRATRMEYYLDQRELSVLPGIIAFNNADFTEGILSAFVHYFTADGDLIRPSHRQIDLKVVILYDAFDQRVILFDYSIPPHLR